MAARLIREDMLESERVQKRSVPARWLFVAIMLTADDVGLFEVSEFKLHRRAAIDEKEIPKLLQELAEADLIRPYSVKGKAYAFVPRFRQRLRVKRTKHPLPPDELMHDDDDAVNKINDLTEKVRTDGGDPPTSAGIRRPEPEPEPEPEEGLPSSSRTVSAGPTRKPAKKTPSKPKPVVPCPYEDIIAAYHERLPELPRVMVQSPARERAIRKVWVWVLSSTLPSGARRAETAEQALVWFGRYFERASHNDFLMGRTQRTGPHANWKCDIDFLMTERGMRHVIEKTETAAA